MPLAVVESDGFHAGVAAERNPKANSGILPPGEQHQGPGWV